MIFDKLRLCYIWTCGQLLLMQQQKHQRMQNEEQSSENQNSMVPQEQPLDHFQPAQNERSEEQQPIAPQNQQLPIQEQLPQQMKNLQLAQMGSIIEISSDSYRSPGLQPLRNISDDPLLSFKSQQLQKNKQTLRVSSGGAESRRQQKQKKKKVKQYITDFSQYIPQSLLVINKTIIPAHIRVGPQYQTPLSPFPEYSSVRRNMQEWCVWKASKISSKNSFSEYLAKFKQLLGENRNEEELIMMRTRLGNIGWGEVIDYVAKNKAELRRIYHNSQRSK